MELVKFFAEWCYPCKQMDITIGDLVDRHVDVEGESEFASQYSVSYIPTLMLISDGEEVDRLVGMHTKRDVETWLSDNGYE